MPIHNRTDISRLRLEAIVACTLCFFLACTLPAVSYYYIFIHDNLYFGPQAWGHWVVVLVVSILGITAHGLDSTFLTALHVAAGAMLGAALGGYNTAFWFAFDWGCYNRNVLSVCRAADVQHAKPILAITGIVTILSMLVPVFYSILALCHTKTLEAVESAKTQMLCFAVETQTALIEAGDKPTVPPLQLAEWVGYLLELSNNGDKVSRQVAQNCRDSLAHRGYNLPINGIMGQGRGVPFGSAATADGAMPTSLGDNSPSLRVFVSPLTLKGDNNAKHVFSHQKKTLHDIQQPWSLSAPVHPISGERLNASVLGLQPLTEEVTRIFAANYLKQKYTITIKCTTSLLPKIKEAAGKHKHDQLGKTYKTEGK